MVTCAPAMAAPVGSVSVPLTCATATACAFPRDGISAEIRTSENKRVPNPKRRFMTTPPAKHLGHACFGDKILKSHEFVQYIHPLLMIFFSDGSYFLGSKARAFDFGHRAAINASDNSRMALGSTSASREARRNSRMIGLALTRRTRSWPSGGSFETAQRGRIEAPSPIRTRL